MTQRQQQMAWTAERKSALLLALRASGGNISAAAEAVSPHCEGRAPGYTSVKYAMRQDPEFALAVEEVRAEAFDQLWAVAWQWATEGQAEGLYFKDKRIFEPVLDDEGQPVLDDSGKPKMKPARTLRKNHQILLRLMSYLKPDFSERKSVDVTHRKAGSVTLELADLAALDHEQRQQLTAILGTVRDARSGEVRAIEHQPIEDAEYVVVHTSASEPTGEPQKAVNDPSRWEEWTEEELEAARNG